MNLDQLSLVVDDYDNAISFFVNLLGFDLVEDSPARTATGRPKRWGSCGPLAVRQASYWLRPTAQSKAATSPD